MRFAKELDAQPHETAYITTDPYAIAEAANTRVSTILYADAIFDTITDLVLEDTATAKAGNVFEFLNDRLCSTVNLRIVRILDDKLVGVSLGWPTPKA